MNDMTTVNKWFIYAWVVLFAFLAIFKSMDICVAHHWGYIPCAVIAIVIFACLYGFLRLCFAVTEFITTKYADVYKNKVLPRIEMKAIDQYIAEHPLPEVKQEEREEDVSNVQVMNSSNELKNATMNLEQFMATCKIERDAMTAAKEKTDAEKLEKVLLYTRSTFMKFDFTDEELFQLNECVKTFVTLRAVLPAVNIHIHKKRTLTQGDLKNFSWNIANQYGIEPALTAQFVLSTFSAWFANTEASSLMKNPKVTIGKLNIEIDLDILKYLDDLKCNISNGD